MSERFERVEPAPFEAPAAQAGTTTTDTPAQQPAWLWPTLVVLLLAATAVVFVLPRMVAAPDPDTASAPAATSPARTGGAPTRDSAGPETPAGSPFADAAAARARSAAQDVLAELLDIQEQLQARGAEEWAAEEMAAIAATATEGDTLYRDREFDAALLRYEAARGEALILEQSIAARFDQASDSAEEAIEDLDEDAASRALALAQQLQPDDGSLAGLESRVAALPAVAAAMKAAQDASAAGELAAAVASLEEARALDPAHRGVAEELSRQQAALEEQRFNAAMSEGYAALDGGNFAAADARFSAAERMRPGAAEATAARAEVEVARTAATLRGLRERGATQLAEEDWQAAIRSFEEALAIDGSLRFAREGLATARPRAVLSSELQEILDEPGKLVDDALLREAQATLEQARALDNIGPRLAELISSAANTLKTAATPVEVTLTSDEESTVTVYKVARLGRFAERTLSLRPGTYTAVASRRGYRDVRREFEVTPRGLAAPVYIACGEAI